MLVTIWGQRAKSRRLRNYRFFFFFFLKKSKKKKKKIWQIKFWNIGHKPFIISIAKHCQKNNLVKKLISQQFSAILWHTINIQLSRDTLFPDLNWTIKGKFLRVTCQEDSPNLRASLNISAAGHAFPCPQEDLRPAGKRFARSLGLISATPHPDLLLHWVAQGFIPSFL